MQCLSIPNYSDPDNPDQTITAFGFINALQVNFTTNKGSLAIGIYRNKTDFGTIEPIEILSVNSGGYVMPGRRLGETFPDIDTISTDQAQIWNNFESYFLSALTNSDRLPGSTVIDV